MDRNVLAIGTALVMTTVVPAVAAAQSASPPTQESDAHYSDGERVPVSVALDALGVLAGEGFSAEEIRGLAQSLGARVTKEFRGGLFLFGFEKARERGELVEIARDIGRRELASATQAGLVLHVRQSDDPVIVTDEFIARFKPGTEMAQVEKLNNENAVRTVMANPYVENQYVLAVTEDSPLDVIGMSARYHEHPLTDSAYPNFISVFTDSTSSDGTEFR